MSDQVPVKLGAVGGKEPCPCGSGKKYKHCCYQKDAASAAPTVARAKEEPTPAEPDQAAPAPESTRSRQKAPVMPSASVRPPSKPPQGSAKALNRRSGHR